MISVIIPTYNRSESLRLCLTALKNQTHRDFEVIVIDDGSDDIDVVKEFGHRYIWHPHDGFGLSRSRNEGTRLAKGELFHFIDSDIMLAPTALENAWKLYQDNPNRAIGGYYRYLPGMVITPEDVTERWEDVWDYELPAKEVGQALMPEGDDVRDAWFRMGMISENPFAYEEEVLWSPFVLLGGNMVIPRHIFQQTDGFDEHFNTYGGEDAEMSLAIISRGYGISYSRRVAGCHIAHKKEASATQGDGGEKEHRRYIATKYPYFLDADGNPRMEVWGLPVQRRDHE